MEFTKSKKSGWWDVTRRWQGGHFGIHPEQERPAQSGRVGGDETHVVYGAKLLELSGEPSGSRNGLHIMNSSTARLPDGLAGNLIPLGARILAIADAYDTITSARTYKKARTSDEAFLELERCGNAQFDPSWSAYLSLGCANCE